MFRHLALSLLASLAFAISSAHAQDVATRILEFFPGEWEMKNADGELLSQVDWKLVAGGKAIAGAGTSATGLSSYVMAGWDPVQKIWLHVYHREDGAFSRLVVTRFEGDTYYGEITQVDPSGESVTSPWENKIIDRNHCVITQRGGSDERMVHFERVQESSNEQPTAYEHLKGLEWMVGSKTGQYTVQEGWDEFAPVGTKVVRRASIRWALNRSLLIASVSTEVAGRSPVKSMEIAGWDPKSEQIVHWIFSPGGGSGSGTWSQDGDTWMLKWTSTTPGGNVYSGTSHMRPTGSTTSEWSISDATKNGQAIADIPTVVFTQQ